VVSLAEQPPLPARRIMRVARWRSRRGPWAHLGVRARVTFVFAMGALLLSVSVGGISYLATQHFLVNDSENAAVQQAGSEAGAVTDGLADHDADPKAVVLAAAGPDSSAVLFQHGKKYPTFFLRAGDIPRPLQALVQSGTAAREKIHYLPISPPTTSELLQTRAFPSIARTKLMGWAT